MNTTADIAKQMTVQEYQKLRSEGTPHMLLDIRTSWEREQACFPESKNIPFDQLPAWADQAPKDQKVVVLCHHGIRSAHACLILEAMGFKDASNLQGGIEAWASEIDPEMKRY